MLVKNKRKTFFFESQNIFLFMHRIIYINSQFEGFNIFDPCSLSDDDDDNDDDMMV